jgi:acyl transferase domain-containing protein
VNYDCDAALATPITDAVAIVGIGCQLPGNISTVDELVSALAEGRDCITDVPADRWNRDAFYAEDPLAPGKTYVRRGGFVSDLDRFDAGFFGVSDAEAERIDPQQRMCLQTVWHALEHAAQSAEELRQSNTGVFLAMMNTNNYSHLKCFYEGFNGLTAYDAMADAMSITAGRISHFLDLNGPCLAVDTACSGSMVALHLARQSVLAGDCDSAIVLGVNAILDPGIHIAFSKVGLMSRVGKCQAFDAAADGYVRSEGCVAVLLRRESIALERGDHIIATVVSSAMNQDGHTPALTAPNGRTQESVIRAALARSGVNPNEIGYVEAHGTGTPVGDPIEMSALTNVYGPGRSDVTPLYVGSVKSNFGHIEAGAGLLGTVKAALSLERETIFPSLHFTQLNPGIDLGHAPIRVATRPVPWPRGDVPRLAGVNSFGYSGTNAHVVLREAPLSADTEALPHRSHELVLLSAKSPDTLEELADRWIAALGADDDPRSAAVDADIAHATLSNIAFTTATGRTAFRHRLAVEARSPAELADRLRAWRSGRHPRGVHSGQAVTSRRKPGVAFVFTGQGAQYAGMSRSLYEAEPVFRRVIDACAIAMAESGFDLKETLYSDRSAELLADTRATQPAIFAVGYALAELLRDWGLVPDAVIGHSVGELAAACVAGALSLTEAAQFVVARAALMSELPCNGAMVSVDATAEEARHWLTGHEAEAAIAALNGPRSVVVSGHSAAIDAVIEQALVAGRRPVALSVSHAFHSPLMDPVLDRITESASALTWVPPEIPIASNLTGEPLDVGHGIRPDYWSRHAREAVRFADGIRALAATGCRVFVEVGPHPALRAAVTATLQESATGTAKQSVAPMHLPTMLRGQDDVASILNTMGELHVRGLGGDIGRLYRDRGYRRATLPLYPFRRNRYWLKSDVGQLSSSLPQDVRPVVDVAAGAAPALAPFKMELAAVHPWADHRILGATLFPAAGYLEMAARAWQGDRADAWRPVTLRGVTFARPLVLDHVTPRSIRMDFEPAAESGRARFAVVDENVDAEGVFCSGDLGAAEGPPEVEDVAAAFAALSSSTGVGAFYGELRQAGLVYGLSFATIRQLRSGLPGSGTAFAQITAAPSARQQPDHTFTLTTMLDGCLQLVAAAVLGSSADEQARALIPAAVRSVTIHQLPVGELWARAAVTVNDSNEAAAASIRAVDSGGQVVADIEGLELRYTLLSGDTDHAVGRHSAHASGPTGKALVAQLRQADPEAQLQAIILWLSDEVRDTLGQAADEIDLNDIDPSMAFLEIGLDSLRVTELQRRIQEKLNFRFEPMQGLDYQSIEALARFLQTEVLSRSVAPVASPV